MKTIFQFRFNNTLAITFALLAILFTSCRKIDSEQASIPDQIPDLVTTVSSSVSGFVTNESDMPVVRATVKVGNTTTTTDRYGYFEVKNVTVVKDAAQVTVTIPGYFKGVKTFAATEGKSAFFRIKLMPKTIAGTVSASSGGSVALTNGLSIALPANAVKNASTGAAYSGAVNVAAQWMDPTSSELYNIMPGDLRGINTDGAIKGLISYGMATIELTGASGELLQVANGKKATLTFPLPTATQASAPSSIPLWYFNDTTGLWKQEGSAIRIGNNYVGEVNHFSSWNCDLPAAVVPLTFTVVNKDRNPMANAQVEIVPLTSNSWSHIGGYTDASGYVSVFTTANADYAMTILASRCGSSDPAYRQNFSVATQPVSLGNINLGDVNNATISGTVTDCNNMPVTDGYILAYNGYQFFRASVNNLGKYEFAVVLCDATANVNFIAGDNKTSKESSPYPYTLTNGSHTINNLQACAISNEIYTNMTINGKVFSYHEWNSGQGSASWQGGASDSSITAISIPAVMVASGIPIDSTQSNLQFYFYSYGLPGTANATYFLRHIANYLNYTGLPVYFDADNKAIPVYVTEYGPVGGFISGSFSGKIKDRITTTYYDVSCNFRLRRY